MKTTTSNDLLEVLSATAREHAGDGQWRSFFREIAGIARTGIGDYVEWRDDGSSRHLVDFNSLLHFGSNIWSQRGDDGIVRRIFQIIGLDTGFFVEFGAWDGVHFANSRALAQRGWSGCFIERNAAKAAQLRDNYSDTPDVLCLQETVLPTAAAGGRTIDEIALRHFPDRQIDFLSIDVDGLDYRIFEEMQMRPVVVCVEGGFAWHPRFDRRLPDDLAARNLGQPLAVMIEIGRRKGYTAVCFNQNVYFVIDSQADHFSSIAKDAVSLWRDAWFNETESFRQILRKFRARERIRTEEGPEFEQLEFDAESRSPREYVVTGSRRVP